MENYEVEKNSEKQYIVEKINIVERIQTVGKRQIVQKIIAIVEKNQRWLKKLWIVKTNIE